MAYNEGPPGAEENRERFEMYMCRLHAGHRHVCVLCNDFVIRNKMQTRRRYGLLQNCNHIFCLYCIRQYVQERLSLERYCWPTEKLHGYPIICPMCEIPSVFIMASDSFITNPMEKAIFTQNFLHNVSKIKCVFYRCGFGACFCVDQTNHDND